MVNMFGFLIPICIVVISNIVIAHYYNVEQEIYTINTEGCQIPAFPLVSDSIRELVAPPAARLHCNISVPALVQANDTHIMVVKTSYDFYNVFVESEFFCCYRNFSAQGNLENVAYGSCQEFTTDIKGQHEFVRVECYYSGDKVYEDLYRFNVFHTKSFKRDERSFSVVMFGLDGVSRQNFIRTMSRTANFLKVRASVQLYGYNKLGENSFPNLFPILTGKSYKEVKERCFRYNTLDSVACKFMWDVYKAAGYRTALAADSGAGVLGVYEPMLKYRPTDFYMQTFMYETRHTFKDRTYDYHLCLRNRYLYKELLRFAQDVFDSVHLGKLFGFFWEESVTHGHLNYAHLMDEDYFRILTNLEKKGNLEDTVVIIFSDHGTRFGEILTTEQGRQESRLPLFEIMFPVRFRRRYKLAYKNFDMNSHRLTTANDVYETLLDLANPSVLEDNQIKKRIIMTDGNSKGISLFLPIPLNRTCKSLDIPEHWCACTPGEKVTVGTKGKVITSRFVLNHINQVLSEYPQCHKLKIEKILDVSATKEKSSPMKRIRIMLETTPGRGMFEATLLQERKQWKLSGFVSRLNSYGNQSYCVKDPIAKNYCFCKK